MATEIDIRSVQITMANGYTMTVVTTKTNVEEILEDNNILVEDDERVTPSLDDEITEETTEVIASAGGYAEVPAPKRPRPIDKEKAEAAAEKDETKEKVEALKSELVSFLEDQGLEVTTGIVTKDNNFFEWK